MYRLKVMRQVFANMGWRYVTFRMWHLMKLKFGILRLQYPTDPPVRTHITLDAWRKLEIRFFFDGRESVKIPRNPSEKLKDWMLRYRKGQRQYFSAKWYDMPPTRQWHTNPVNGYVYTPMHWTRISDFDPEAGDIKYVWEPSRFCHLYHIIRYDYHFNEDCAAMVFEEIEDWMDENPLNTGPNYICSQEISVRVMNWLFALHYYKNSEVLTEPVFQRIVHFIYWQLRHVRRNIRWSLIAVRNNHALTETLMLLLSGALFPFFIESRKWSARGLRWFEREVTYQFAADGTYIQYSMNYHRVAVQLLSWAMYLCRNNHIELSETLHQKALQSINFLYQCQDEQSGMLPNYGTNDGALFFPLTNCEYRDYRPQVNALYRFFYNDDLYHSLDCQEEGLWYGAAEYRSHTIELPEIKRKGTSCFHNGGYYTIRDDRTLSFLRCGDHPNRPAQADNLHLDLWVDGQNVLWDAGTFRYNEKDSIRQYFRGTRGHNTVRLNGYDQMSMGPRFIWLYWTQSDGATIKEVENTIVFTGTIRAFGQLSKDIMHRRVVRKSKSKLYWEVTDSVHPRLGYPLVQTWNISEGFLEVFGIRANDHEQNVVKPQIEEAWYSDRYGVKEQRRQLVFTTSSHEIHTSIWSK